MNLNRVRPYLMLVFFGVCACSTTPAATDSKRTSELAEKLVSCENERNDLRDKLQMAQAEVQKTQDRVATTVKAPADPGAAEKGQVHREGRTPSRRMDRARDMPSVHPMVHGAHDDSYRGPDNPAGEAREAEAVASTIKTHFSQFRPCYERGLKRNSNLQFVTQIKVRLTMNAQGKPQGVHTTPRTDSDMEECMTQVIAHWPLPPYKGKPVLLEVPVSLKVQGQ